MAAILRRIGDAYNFVFYELADQRSVDMFPSPMTLITIVSLYLYFCTKLGPRLMSDRKPFKLRTPIFYYNLFQIFICKYIIYLAIRGGWFTGYNFRCQPVDMTENYQSRTMLNAYWWYTTVKIIDLMDTVFFVLRKKDRQISFLHLFHHSMMPVASFIGFKYYPNGHASFLGLLNCIVHVVMYFYYLIAGLGPKYQKYLWWKKHLTTMQLVQFGMIFIHNLAGLTDSSCTYPKWVMTLLCIHSLQFVYLFGKFYYENYIMTPKSKASNGTAANISNGKSKVH